MPDPTTTPALDRATAAMTARDVTEPLRTFYPGAARDAVSAALTDPDDPDWLARLLCYAGVESVPVAAPVCDRHLAEAAAVRAAILGESA